MKFFVVKEFFFVNFYFKNGCKNESEDNNEKSCSRFRNRETAWELSKLIFVRLTLYSAIFLKSTKRFALFTVRNFRGVRKAPIL